MGLDNLSSASSSIILKRYNEDLIIETSSNNKEIFDAETVHQFKLSSFFSLLENGCLAQIQPTLNIVTSLDLSGCNLTEFPKTIKSLNLKKLNLSKNNLTQVPACLYGGGVRSLENLDLSYNKITHFEFEPDCILNLKILKLNNNLFESVPKWFLTFRCTNLLEFSYNENKAVHYNFLANSFNIPFMKLKRLELKNCCLIDKDFRFLKCFRNLEFLDISNKSAVIDLKYINRFREIDQLFVKPSWLSLRVLKLDCLNLAIFPDGIFWIESLKELYITKNLLSWISPGLEYLVNLEILDISDNQLACIPEKISCLLSLRILLASGNKIVDLPSMPEKLEVLDVYDNNIEALSSDCIRHVRYVDLEYNNINLQECFSLEYGDYCSKRDNFRNVYNISNRCLNDKYRNESDNFSSSSDISGISEEDLFNTEDSNDVNTCIEQCAIPEEDWDANWDDSSKETSKVFRHPDISLSDNEYNGERESESQQGYYRERKVYVDYDEWMFVDAD